MGTTTPHMQAMQAMQVQAMLPQRAAAAAAFVDMCCAQLRRGWAVSAADDKATVLQNRETGTHKITDNTMVLTTSMNPPNKSVMMDSCVVHWDDIEAIVWEQEMERATKTCKTFGMLLTRWCGRAVSAKMVHATKKADSNDLVWAASPSLLPPLLPWRCWNIGKGKHNDVVEFVQLYTVTKGVRAPPFTVFARLWWHVDSGRWWRHKHHMIHALVPNSALDRRRAADPVFAPFMV